MTGKSHQYFGLSYSLLVAALMSLAFIVHWRDYTGELSLFFLGVMMGSVFPDIDAKKSRANRLFPFLSWCYAIFKHRGVTHSLLGLLIFSGIAGFLVRGYPELWFGFTLGYISHLCGDMLTPMGCPLFWPWSERFRFPIYFTTGSVWEYIFVVVFSAISFWVVFL